MGTPLNVKWKNDRQSIIPGSRFQYGRAFKSISASMCNLNVANVFNPHSNSLNWLEPIQGWQLDILIKPALRWCTGIYIQQARV